MFILLGIVTLAGATILLTWIVPESMEYKLHPKFHADQITEEEVNLMLTEAVDEFDDVSYGGERIEKSADPEILIAGTMLVVNTIATLVAIYKLFKDDPRVQYINLLNPGSDTLIVQAESVKVQKIKNPEKYEFHEVDGDVTLIECDNMDDFREANSDLDSEGLVLDLDFEE